MFGIRDIISVKCRKVGECKKAGGLWMEKEKRKEGIGVIPYSFFLLPICSENFGLDRKVEKCFGRKKIKYRPGFKVCRLVGSYF